MTSIRQKALAENIIKNQSLSPSKRKNKSELVEGSGYTEIQSKKKQKEIMESKGVQKELKVICDEAGLTEELIAESLVFDIENKPRKREKEMRLGADILGMTKNKSEATPNILQNIALFIKNKESLQEPLHIDSTTVELDT